MSKRNHQKNYIGEVSERRTLPLLLSRHAVALVIFAVLILYGTVIVRRCSLPKVENLCYYFHAVDFNLGFCCNFLPGAIYNLFVKEPTPESATVYESILLIVFYAVVSVLLERLVLLSSDRYRPTVLLLLAFYLTGPATFAPYIYKLGMLDVYWLFLTIPFLLMLRNRYARLALPLFFILIVMIHFGAMITYVPFFALLIVYELAGAKEKRDRRGLTAVLVAGVVLAAGTFLYFCAKGQENVTVSIEEFNQIMDERGVESKYYFDFALYGRGEIDDLRFTDNAGLTEFYPEAPAQLIFPDDQGSFLRKIINVVAYQVQLQFYFYTHQEIGKRTLLQFVMLTVVLLPLLLFLQRFFFSRFRDNKQNRLSRFLYLCLIAFFPCSVIVSLIVSTDSVRWIDHVFFAMFTFLMYLIYKEKEPVLASLDQTLREVSHYLVGLFFLIYSITAVNPYV